MPKNYFTRKMIDFDTKLPNNVGDLGKIIVATGLEWLLKVQKVAQSGHIVYNSLIIRKNTTQLYRCYYFLTLLVSNQLGFTVGVSRQDLKARSHWSVLCNKMLHFRKAKIFT